MQKRKSIFKNVYKICVGLKKRGGMMSDLTSRSALIKRMNEYVFDAFDCDGIDAENVLEYQQTHNDNSTYIIQGFNDVYELLEEIPTVDAVPLSEIYRVIAGHSNYHGDSILSALTCIAEGKEVKPIKPLE